MPDPVHRDYFTQWLNLLLYLICTIGEYMIATNLKFADLRISFSIASAITYK